MIDCNKMSGFAYSWRWCRLGMNLFHHQQNLVTINKSQLLGLRLWRFNKNERTTFKCCLKTAQYLKISLNVNIEQKVINLMRVTQGL